MLNRLQVATIALLGLNLLGIILLYKQTRSLSQTVNHLTALTAATDFTQLNDRLSSVQDQLHRLSSPILGTSNTSQPGQLSQLLPNLEVTPANVRYVTANSPSPVTVYKEQADFSPPLDTLQPGRNYPFISLYNDWYLIQLPTSQTGWVKASLVTPVEP